MQMLTRLLAVKNNLGLPPVYVRLQRFTLWRIQVLSQKETFLVCTSAKLASTWKGRFAALAVTGAITRIAQLVDVYVDPSTPIWCVIQQCINF